MNDLTADLLDRLRGLPDRRPAVTVIGDLNYDTIYVAPTLQPGKEVIISDLSRSLAGAAGYVSCGLARLGAEVFFLTALGDDEDGRSLYEEAGRRGLEQDGIRRIPGRRSPFTLIFSELGEERPRQVATYLGTLADLSLESLDWEPRVARSGLLYSCNYFIMPRLREEIGRAFRFARERGVLTAYDANAGDGWEDPRNLELLKDEIHPHADIIFLNEAEAEFLTGAGRGAGRPGAGPGGLEQAIRSIGPPESTVVIKLGPRGLLLRHGGRTGRVSAFPLSTPVQDTVGAGDSFQAAFLYFTLRGFPPELCGVLGAANAASTVLHPGGTRGQLDPDGLAGFLRGFTILDNGKGEIRMESRAGRTG